MPLPGDRVVLVTIDGARTEEVFGGLDLAVLESTCETAAARRDDCRLPALLGADARGAAAQADAVLLEPSRPITGSIAGDGASGSVVRLSNLDWFSYPGYAGMLLGEPHDAEI